MEAKCLDEERDFGCPECGEINIHRCKPGTRMAVWCPKCKKTTEYHVHADGGVEVIGKE